MRGSPTRIISEAAREGSVTSRSFPSCASLRASTRYGSKRMRRRSCGAGLRSEEHTSELQSLMRISYAVFCLKKKKQHTTQIDKTIVHTSTSTTSQYEYINTDVDTVLKTDKQ